MISAYSRPAALCARIEPSAARITDELYPPHRPRSAAMTTWATRRTSARGTRYALSEVPPAAARSRTTCVIWSAYGAAACTRAWARTIRLAAMSSIARVIFFVELMLRIRRRRTRS